MVHGDDAPAGRGQPGGQRGEDPQVGTVSVEQTTGRPAHTPRRAGSAVRGGDGVDRSLGKASSPSQSGSGAPSSAARTRRSWTATPAKIAPVSRPGSSRRRLLGGAPPRVPLRIAPFTVPNAVLYDVQVVSDGTAVDTSGDGAVATRRRLTRQAIVHEALALLEEHGAGALSMRRLADRLGVTLNALYSHVLGKADLIDALVDEVYA